MILLQAHMYHLSHKCNAFVSIGVERQIKLGIDLTECEEV